MPFFFSSLYLHPKMKLETICRLYQNHPNFSVLAKGLVQDTQTGIQLKGLVGSSMAFLFSSLFHALDKSFFMVFNDKEEAAYFFDDLDLLTGKVGSVVFLPSSFRRSVRQGKVDQDNIVLRTEALNKITGASKTMVVTYPEALAEKVISDEALKKNTLSISVGDKLSIEFVNEVLIEYGFERVDFVFEPGQFSLRGGIVDVFSFSSENPYRIDFFGNEVESIRSFDAETQISSKSLASISVIPDIQHGLSNEKRMGIFDYLPEGFVVALTDTDFLFSQVESTCNSFLEGSLEIFDENEEKINLGERLCQPEELGDGLSRFSKIYFATSRPVHGAETLHFATVPQPQFNKNFDLLANDMRINAANGVQNFLLSNNEKQVERLQTIFDDRNLNVKMTPLPFTVHEGFIDKDLLLAFYTDHQVFERYHRYSLQTRRKQAKEALSIKELNKLHQGDYVVHIDHGVGRFAGLVKTEVNGKIQEAIRLVYRDNDSLLVSIHSLHRISKFKGKEGTEPSLNKLGTAAWNKMKQKAKSKVKDIAKELIALYAARLQEHGYAFSSDTLFATGIGSFVPVRRYSRSIQGHIRT